MPGQTSQTRFSNFRFGMGVQMESQILAGSGSKIVPEGQAMEMSGQIGVIARLEMSSQG